MGDVEVSFMVQNDIVAVEEGLGLDIPVKGRFALGSSPNSLGQLPHRTWCGKKLIPFACVTSGLPS